MNDVPPPAVKTRATHITLAKAEIVDAAALIEIKQRAFAEEFALYHVTPPFFDSLEHQQRAIANGLYFKILDGHRMVGGSGVIDRGNGEFSLGSLYIDRNDQKKGIGRIALHLIEQTFPTARKWSLETPSRSCRNHRFYENAGYVKVGEYHPGYAQDEAFILFQYEKYPAPTVRNS